jgi:hypothetical protein
MGSSRLMRSARGMGVGPALSEPPLSVFGSSRSGNRALMHGAAESPTSYPVPRPFGFCSGWDCSRLMRSARGMGAKRGR